MPIVDDTALAGAASRIEIVRPVGRRRVSHAFHDVDGTHSLIRDWPPVMSAVIHYAMTSGLPADFDSDADLDALVGLIGQARTDETDRFCIESAGLSALTQMEFAIRRAIELGHVPPEPALALGEAERRANSEICRRIWAGRERFADIAEPAALRAFIDERTPRLFRFYERLLNRVCRDRNLAAARRDPAAWRVPGSAEFLDRLHRLGCINYFVTGAVIYQDGGMLEEVRTLGFPIGPGRTVETILGSTWDRKVPKGELFEQMMAQQGVAAANVLVVGDGRAEIEAAVRMGAVSISRLGRSAGRQRELHRQIGTSYIVEDFTDPALTELIRPDDGTA